MPSPPQRLPENHGLAFIGDDKRGRFELSAAAARRLLAAPNRHGKPNSDVVRRWAGAAELRRAAPLRWIIDFPPDMEERVAELYELPFARIRRQVRPAWGSRRPAWWIHGGPRPEMRVALARRDRYIATPAAGHPRAFVWLEPDVLPDRSLAVFARDDDYFLGVVHSRHHDVWARWAAAGACGPKTHSCYAPASCFETFPFPWPPATPLGKLTRAQEEQRTTIAHAARVLDAQRRDWLGHHPDPERTPASLYRAHPAWLQQTHTQLDEAVAAAYGWPADLPDDDVIQRLLALNQQRAASQLVS